MEVPPCWSSMFYTAQPHKVGDAKLLRLPIWHSLETLNFSMPVDGCEGSSLFKHLKRKIRHMLSLWRGSVVSLQNFYFYIYK